jgi:predicted O-methyltransferase YrrM
MPNEALEALLQTAARTPAGAFVEIGVYQGGSAERLSNLAELQRRPIYLYDTFTGIPYRDDIDKHRVGDFSDGDERLVRARCPYATVIAGCFPASAIPMEPIAFAHLDCDQYRAYCESIDYLLPLMTQGGLMWFDDAPWLEGATQAVMERFSDRLQIAANRYYVEV